MHYAVHHSLLAAGAGGLLTAGRVVHPDVHALYQHLCQSDVVVGYEHNLAYELGQFGNLHDALDKVASGLVGGVSLACKQELHGALGVVHNLGQAVQILEEQERTLVGCKAAGETNCEHIAAQGRFDLDNLAGRIVRGGLGVGENPLHVVNKALAQHAADAPDIFVGNLVDAAEARFVVVVGGESLAEYLGVDGLPFGRGPGGVVDTVGHIAHVDLFGQIAGPHSGQNLLAYLAVQPADAVDALGDVGCQNAHREFLAGIVYVVTAKPHKGVPVNLQTCGELTEVYAHHIFAEEVVAGGNRGVGCEQ